LIILNLLPGRIEKEKTKEAKQTHKEDLHHSGHLLDCVPTDLFSIFEVTKQHI
jgi:hypothetical protein